MNTPNGLLAGLRVLILDEDPETTALLLSLFGHAGADVRAAPDGTAGVPAVFAFRPHAVVYSLTLPGLDVFALVDWLDRLDPAAPPVVVARSGAISDPFRRELSLAGVSFLFERVGDSLVAAVAAACRQPRRPAPSSQPAPEPAAAPA